MKNFARTLERNPTYFTGYFIFALLLSIYCVFIPKADGFLIINHLHYRLLDDFFILFTNIGNGLFVIGLMLVMLFRRKFGWSLQIGAGFIVSGLIVQCFKHLIYSPRPKLFFGPNSIYCINGITGTGNSSFPSGHTATIFALVTLFSLYFPGRKSGLLFLAIAVLAGFSRIYLSQHFPIDVLAGSFIGCLTSLFVYRLIPLKTFQKKFPANEWEQQSVKLR
jgi:membrane-associated phospholipid phosphatase